MSGRVVLDTGRDSRNSEGTAVANVQGEGSIKGLPQNKGEVTTIRRFLELLEAADILPAVDMAAIKQQLPEAKRDQDAAEIARKLVSQHALTKHQAASLYQQRPKSLGLGSYIFLDRLGTGGSGSVFKAKHRKSGDIVAVKVLNLSGSRSPDALKRFQREAETAARLNHPNIVRALDSGEAGGQYFTAMELVEGTDLSTYVKKSGPLPWEQAAQCVVTSARALAYAHEQGIIHRDIKPANLMLCNDGKIKVLDMGLARLQDPSATGNEQAAEGLTQTGQVMGTVDYMAPEQALHTRLADARADVYSLGCTLYRLVTGDIPYDGDSMVAKILSHRETPVPSMRKKNPKVPNTADIVLQKMLAKKPEDRYQSMNELADELERCTQGYDIAPLTPPVNLPAAVASPDAASHSTNSLTIHTSTSTTGMPSGVTKNAEKEKLPLRRKTPVWIPIAASIVAIAAVGGIAWYLNNERLTASNEPEIEKAIPPAEPNPTPATPSAIAPAPLPSSTGSSSARPTPTGLASATRPTISVQGNTPPVPELTPTDDRGVAFYSLGKGYHLVVYDHIDSESREVKATVDLPPNSFTVMAILTPSPNLSIGDLLTRVAAARSLSGISFKGAIIPPGSLESITGFAKMQTLIFNDSTLDDAQLKSIETVSTLRQLELAQCTHVTTAALDTIARLIGLLHLNLAGMKVNDADLAKLAGISGLRTLNLENASLTDAAVATLSGFTNLQSLTIRGTQISPDGRQRLASALPSCKIDPPQGDMTLALSLPSGSAPPVNPPVAGPSGTSSVAQTPPATPGTLDDRTFATWFLQRGFRVSIHDYSVSNQISRSVNSMNELPAGPFAVMRVYLYTGAPITTEVFDKLAAAPPHMAAIYFGSTTAGNIDPTLWRNLARLTKIRHLGLGRTSFTDADCAALRALPELTSLDLAHTQVTGACLDVLTTIPRLSLLSLQATAIADTALGKFAQMPQLRRLRLEETPVSDNGITAILNCPNLQTLIVRNTQVTDAAKQRIRSTMPGCEVDGGWYSTTISVPPLSVVQGLASSSPNTNSSGTGILGTPVPMAPLGPPPVPVAKLPVPTEDKLAPSLKLIREELFKDKYAAAKKPEERVSLAAELLGQATDLGDDANGTYAMLREARDMAADGGDITLAFSACGNAEQRFELDALEWLAEACEVSVKKTLPRNVSKAIGEGLAAKVDDAANVQNYAVAERLLDTALAAARKSLDSNLIKQLVEREKQVTVLKKTFDEVTAARKTLTEKADDPAANLVVGKYACFVEGKWDEGLPILAKGSDPIFKGLAEKSVGKTSAEWIAAGDLWWAQGEKSPKAAQKEFLLAALYFYDKAVFELTGLQKTRIDKRIADARVVLGDAVPKPVFVAAAPPPLTGISSPPASSGTTATNPAAAAIGLPLDQQRFVAFVFARGGGVVIDAWSLMSGGTISRSSSNTNTVYSDAELMRYNGRVRNGIVGFAFYSSRGARLSDDDLRSMASAPWLKRISFEGMPLTNGSLALIGGMTNVDYLYIANAPQVSDAGIAALARCARLNTLILNQTGVTGAGFARLNGLPIYSLTLNQSRLDDAGMVGIAALSQLSTISFDDTSVSEAGFARLSVLQNLRSIHADRTRINGSSFANFASGLSMSYLHLNETQLNDTALGIIGRMTELDTLYIENTPITDAGVAKLVGLDDMSSLYLNGCAKVTDASVPTFARMRNLYYLSLRNCGVTPNGAQSIRNQNTRVTVYMQ